VRRCELVEEPVGLELHDHIAWAHEGTADFRQGLISFLDEGLAAGEQLLYVAPRSESDMLADVDALIDHDEHLASGRLVVYPVGRRTSDFSPAEAATMMQGLRERVGRALAGGYRCLRMASEVTQTFATDADAAAQLRFECSVDQIAAALPFVALCAIDRHRVAGPPEQALFAVHHLRGGQAGAHAPWLQAVGDDAWVLRGQVDMVNSAAFGAALAALPAAMRGTCLHIWVDQLEFIDVAGLRALVGLADAVAHKGGDAVARKGGIVLYAPPDWLVKMITLSFGDVRGLELAGGDGHRGTR
jgi:hypothetical protein